MKTDLNRCFSKKFLADLDSLFYEYTLAPKNVLKIEDNQTDLIIDLHSTTFQMGLTIIICDGHPFH